MIFNRFLNTLTFVLFRVFRGLKNNKKPTPLKIAQLPQISTENFDEEVYISPRSSPGLNGPLWAQLPKNLLYSRFQKNGFNGISTVLTGVYGRLNGVKTKKVLKVQKSKKDQPRFWGFFYFGPRGDGIPGLLVQKKGG